MTNDNFRDLIAKLKYLSFIQKNEKISTKDSSVYKNNWYDFIYRQWVQPESRIDTINFLEARIDDTFTYLKNCPSVDKRDTIIQCLKECTIGIENLRYTYKNDPCMKGKFDSILIEINAKILEYTPPVTEHTES